MALVIVFAVTLLAAILVSELAKRSVLSTAVMFLGAGFLVGEGVANVVPIQTDDEAVRRVAEITLFAVLFTDGMQAGVRDLTSAWRLPGRALVLGLPLTLTTTSLLAHFVAGLPWGQSFLVGAVLSPTDPVFASALVGREGVPRRLSHLLNVESGLNDGLALPVVIALLAVVGEREIEMVELLEELGLGVLIGVAIPLVAIKLEQVKLFSASLAYEPLYPFAIGVLVFAVASATHGNLFLAAFAAGITVTSVSERFKDAFHRFGELLAELLKLLAILIFGALISPQLLGDIGINGYAFAFLALIAARPIALSLSFLGSGIESKEWAAAAWFGPKGFASVVYGLLILDSGAPRAGEMFHLIAVVVAASILAHSSTDVLIARQFKGVDIGASKQAERQD